tara:strand:- start:9179 stop:9817 length:639 start_codon:yes stop_codon:yes gene_type:complete
MAEPVTAITDFLLCLLSLYCGVRLTEQYWKTFQVSHFHLSCFFFLLIISSVLGGLFHTFRYSFTETLVETIWTLTMASAGVTVFFLLLFIIAISVSYRTFSVIKWIPIVALFVFIGKTTQHFSTSPLFQFSIPPIIFSFIIIGNQLIRQPSYGVRMILRSLCIFLIGGLILQSGISFSIFNHNDLFHLFMMLGICVLYRGGSEIDDYDKSII